MKRILNPLQRKTEPYFSRNYGILEVLALVLFLFPWQRSFAQNVSDAARPHTVHVAPPSGDQLKDHKNIVAAFRHAQPGDTILFARGMYTVGEIIRVTTPHLTLQGNPGGTVLRGCKPETFDTLRLEEKKVLRVMIQSQGRTPLSAHARARETELVKRCGMFQLTGGHDTVRDLTFEYMRLGLMLGYEPQQGYRPSDGGYLVEGNTFRNSDNGIRVGLSLPEPTLIRHNTFVDSYHAVVAGGSNIHVLDNTILAPVPEQVPSNQYPSLAIGITAIALGPKGSSEPPNGRCDDNVIAGNFIIGYPDGIALDARPGTGCRKNIIRNNTIAVRRVAFPGTSVDVGLFHLRDKTDSSFVGIPISVSASVRNGHSGIMKDNLIKGNRILGAEGYGIGINHASNNQIVDNSINGIIAMNHFPGNGGFPKNSRKGNGSGIWVSAGSNGNEIIDNTFRDISIYSIVLEGDSNIVRMRRPNDTIYDLGTGNRVERPVKR